LTEDSLHTNLEEALIAANSNPEFVGELMADFTRKLMGQSISMSPSASQSTAAFAEILRYMRGFTGPDLYAAVSVAQDSLRVDHQDDRYVSAAQAGTRYLLAKSSNDGFAAARASKAGSIFRDEMRLALRVTE
jgi:hypothetical protein